MENKIVIIILILVIGWIFSLAIDFLFVGFDINLLNPKYCIEHGIVLGYDSDKAFLCLSPIFIVALIVIGIYVYKFY